MDKQLTLSSKFKILTAVMIVIGIAALLVGAFTDPARFWANLLLNNYYFVTVAIGASFWLALQYASGSGWSAGFLRVPQGISTFIPVAAITMLPVLFGMGHLYHWAHHDALADPVIAHKSPYLNMPFFIGRYLVFYAAWTLITWMLIRYSLKEDKEGGLKWFKKSQFLSKVYIFVLAVTFSLSAFDWIMSIDVHWYSTIFGIRNFAMAFFHGSVIVTMVVIILNKLGYFPFLNPDHLRDFSRYILVLCIIWTYTWFAQYILIWFANIPEETVYYLPRTKGEFKPFFHAELIINWLIPFIPLLSRKLGSNANILLGIGTALIIGQWIDLYQQIFPGTVKHFVVGFVEIGSFIGFLGLFTLVVAWSLTRRPLVQKNHPYLEECLRHHR
jgi:hypothetical protein